MDEDSEPDSELTASAQREWEGEGSAAAPRYDDIGSDVEEWDGGRGCFAAAPPRKVVPISPEDLANAPSKRQVEPSVSASGGRRLTAKSRPFWALELERKANAAQGEDPQPLQPPVHPPIPHASPGSGIQSRIAAGACISEEEAYRLIFYATDEEYCAIFGEREPPPAAAVMPHRPASHRTTHAGRTVHNPYDRRDASCACTETLARATAAGVRPIARAVHGAGGGARGPTQMVVTGEAGQRRGGHGEAKVAGPAPAVVRGRGVELS